MWKYNIALPVVVVTSLIVGSVINHQSGVAVCVSFVLLMATSMYTSFRAAVFCDSLGKPITVDKLKKRVHYAVMGKGSFTLCGGPTMKVWFVQTGNDSIKAVILPMELPENSNVFCVVPDFDEYGERKKGYGAIMVFDSMSSPKKLSFSWKKLRPA